MNTGRYITASESDFEKITNSDLVQRHINRGTLYILYHALCYLEYQYIGNNEDWFASINDIAEKSGMSNRSVIRGIKVLEELGLLRVVRDKYSKGKGKRLEENRYKITGSTITSDEEITRMLSKESL